MQTNGLRTTRSMTVQRAGNNNTTDKPHQYNLAPFKSANVKNVDTLTVNLSPNGNLWHLSQYHHEVVIITHLITGAS